MFNPLAVRATGAGLIALGLGFNVPYSLLAARFDYPGILRRPTEEILAALVAGGPGLLAIWYAFALSALVFTPLALAHALTEGRIRRMPGLAVAAAILGALAGVLQAAGLLRWVLVMPSLAGLEGSDAAATALHAFGGAVLGEHLGQLLTAGHLGTMALVQRLEGRRVTAGLGVIAAAAIATGAFETIAIAMGQSGEAFGLVAIAGYLGLSLWLVVSGAGLIGRPERRSVALG